MFICVNGNVTSLDDCYVKGRYELDLTQVQNCNFVKMHRILAWSSLKYKSAILNLFTLKLVA